jgi:hypothetical protein
MGNRDRQRKEPKKPKQPPKPRPAVDPEDSTFITNEMAF